MTKKLKQVAMIVFALFSAGTSFAQINLADAVPADPALRTGKLPNGLTYYIRHNEEPKERASFYIIQNVGALLENDDQNGLAHFLEHMAFNGTQHFPDKGILNTLQKHGVAFGRNINAYTSFDETVYNLSEVPTTHPGLVDTCLLILNDWAHYLLLTDTEIDAERGVITEEWRTRRTSSFRIRNQFFPVLFKDSKYAVRDVIGNLDVIKNFKYQTLRDFYHDFYRSDLQAIAIVGDIDVDAVEAKVKTMFSKIPAVNNPRKRDFFEVPVHNDTRFVLATDKEATQSQVMIYKLMPNNDGQPKTLADMRESYVRSLYNAMFNTRIQELLQKGAPFINGSNQISGFVRGYDSYSINTTAKPNDEAGALEAILTETERVRRFGFTQTELERAKTTLLANMESQFKQRDKINNDSYCREYRDLYLENTPSPGIAYEYNFAKTVMPGITPAEMLALAQKWITPGNRTIIVTGPAEGVTHLTEAQANAIVEKVSKMPIKPYVDETLAASLVAEPLKGGKIVKTRELKELDAVEWTLANKATVVFRKADYEKDNVSMNAFSKGGSSLLDNSLEPSADLSGEFMSAYGVGDFSAMALRKMLAGKKAGVSPYIGELFEGFNGSATPKDFETMMQLTYLYFAKPRFDAEAHASLMSRYEAYVQNLEKDPQKILGDSVAAIMASYNPRVRPMSKAFLNDVSLAKIQQVYTDRIKDAGDFTFVIVGNIDRDTAKMMVQKYLGSLKNDKRKETWKDLGIAPPKGKTTKEIELDLTTPKTTVVVNTIRPLAYTQYNSIMLSVVKSILDLRYTEEIREKEGGTYGVRVSAGLSHYPVSKGMVKMQFDCEPARAAKLKSLIYTAIDTMMNVGVSQVDFDKTIKNLRKDREQSKAHNNFWMSAIVNQYMNGVNTALPENYEQIVDKITPADVKAFAKMYFDGVDTVDLMFKPKAD